MICSVVLPPCAHSVIPAGQSPAVPAGSAAPRCLSPSLFPAVLPSATSELLLLSHQRDKQVQELQVGVGTAGSPADCCTGQGELPAAGTAQGWAALGKAASALAVLSAIWSQQESGSPGLHLGQTPEPPVLLPGLRDHRYSLSPGCNPRSIRDHHQLYPNALYLAFARSTRPAVDVQTLPCTHPTLTAGLLPTGDL